MTPTPAQLAVLAHLRWLADPWRPALCTPRQIRAQMPGLVAAGWAWERERWSHGITEAGRVALEGWERESKEK